MSLKQSHLVKQLNSDHKKGASFSENYDFSIDISLKFLLQKTINETIVKNLFSTIYYL